MTNPNDEFEVEEEYINCACGGYGHTIKLSHYPNAEHDKNSICVNYCLYQYNNFFKRCWLAFKYMFKIGYTQTHFSETILEGEELEKFKRFLEKVKTDEC